MADIGIDKTTGAPLNVRAVVASFNKPEDKLKALKQYFPDAEPTDGTMLGEGNFVYTDPETGLLTLYNETDGGLFDAGISAGDVLEFGKEIVQTAGGMIGGGIATVAGQAGPQMFTPEEMITVPAGAAMGSELAGQGYDIAMDLMLDKPISRGTLPERVVGAGENVFGEMVAGKAFQKLLDGAGSVSKGVIQKVLGVTGERKELAKKSIQDAQELGVKIPTAGVATNAPIIQFIEKRLEQFPTGAGKFRDTFDEFKRNIVSATDEISQKYSKDSGIEGGEIGSEIKKGINKAKFKFLADQTKLYDEAFDLVGDGAKGELKNLKKLKADLLVKYNQNPKAFGEYMGGSLKKIEDILSQEGVMDLKALRELRTAIRLSTDATGIGTVGITKPQSRYMTKVYDALTDDIKGIVLASGGEKAAKAMAKADAYTANRMKFDVVPVINKILDMDTDLKAYNFLVQGSKESSDQLKRVLRNLPENERNFVKASMLNRLGYQKPGGAKLESDFSVNSFLTNFSKLSNSSKDALFDKDTKARQSLDKIVDLLENFKSAQSYANVSKTGDMIATAMAFIPLGYGGFMVQGGDLISGGLTMASGLIPPHYMSKLVTNEKFINWIADASPKMGRNPADIPFHLGRLMEIFSGDESMSAAALSYVNALVPSIVGSAEASNMTEGVLQEPQTPSEIVQFAKELNPATKEKIRNMNLINLSPVPEKAL